MSVTDADVRHIAALARLGVPDERLPSLVRELNGILAHMAVLQKVDTQGVSQAAGVGDTGAPLREDTGPAYPLARPLDSFAPRTGSAPAVRDGFLLVPRLATHEGLGEMSDADAAAADSVADDDEGREVLRKADDEEERA